MLIENTCTTWYSACKNVAGQYRRRFLLTPKLDTNILTNMCLISGGVKMNVIKFY
jgi:hypothetical protein